MEEIISYFSVIVILINLLSIPFRKRGVALSCGLAGWGGREDVPMSGTVKQKLITLMLINQSRGEDGCGYYNGSEVYKGVDKLKKFNEFVIEKGIEDGDGKNNVFIGHVRKSSFGGHTLSNTHPFLVKELVGNEDGSSTIDNKLVLAHNGTITDVWALATKHGVKHNNIHVDSLALAEIIAKDGWGVLDEYVGTAALLIHKIDEPNTLYVYRGESRDKEGGELKEERPLFFLRTPEGVYFSSIEDALKVIRDKDNDQPEKLPFNKVFRVYNGEIYDGNIVVNRENNNIKKVYSHYNNYGQGSQKVITWDGGGYEGDWDDRYDFVNGIHVPKQTKDKKIPNSTTYSGTSATRKKEDKIYSEKCLDINLETVPPYAFENKNVVYYNKSRHWLGDILLHGECFINKKTRTIEPTADTLNRTEVFYFWYGAMLKSKTAYDILENAKRDIGSTLQVELTNPLLNFAETISLYCKYPVCALEMENSIKDTRWYLNGVPAINGFSPSLSDRNYHFNKKGFLIRIGTTDKEDKILVLKKEGDKTTETFQEEFPDEIYEAEKLFRRVFTEASEAYRYLSQLCLEALFLYAEDLLEDFMGLANPSDSIVKKFVDDMIENAVKEAATIEEMRDPRLPDFQSYLVDAFDDEGVYEAPFEADGKEGADWQKDNSLAPVNPMVKELIKTAKVVSLRDENGYVKLNGGFEDGELIDVEVINTQEEKDKWMEDERACQIAEQFLKDLEKLRTNSLAFFQLQNSDFAQDFYRDVTTDIDMLKASLIQTCQDHKKNILVKIIKDSMKAMSGVY